MHIIGSSKLPINIFYKYTQKINIIIALRDTDRETRGRHTNVPSSLVPVVGLEPTRYRYQRILSPSRLPIPSHRLSGTILAYADRQCKRKEADFPARFHDTGTSSHSPDALAMPVPCGN